MLVRRGAITAAEERRERGRPARLGDDAEHAPQAFLGGADGVVVDQDHLLDMALAGGGKPISSPTWRGAERIRGQSACYARIDRSPGGELIGECRRGLGFDPDHTDVAPVPARHAADQSAAAHRHEQCIEISPPVR